MTNIALVDDESNILTSVSLALENEGFVVDTYQNGEDALIGLEKGHYDLGLFGDTLNRIVLREYPHRLKDFINSFSGNQVACKKWLVEQLLLVLKERPDLPIKKITILGSWYGNVIVPLLIDNVKGIEDIHLIDMDEDALDIGRKFLGRKYKNVNIQTLII